MAPTKTRRPPARRGQSRSRPSGPAARKPPAAKGRPAAKKAKAKKPKQPSRLRAAARTQLRGHGSDAIALGFLALAALTMLALATDLAGPVGSALSDGVTALLGNGAFLVPLGFLTVAVMLLWRRSDAPGAPLRVGLGVGAVVLAAVGLLHFSGGSPALSDPIDALRNGGGYLGALVGIPLSAAIGTAGAGIVLIALLSLGLLLASGLSLHEV